VRLFANGQVFVFLPTPFFDFMLPLGFSLLDKEAARLAGPSRSALCMAE